MSETIFIRATDAPDRADALREAVVELQLGHRSQATYTAIPESFDQLPGAPFAYWIGKEIRSLLSALPSFEPSFAEVRAGLQSLGANDQFIRIWWETPPSARGKSNRWVDFAKGGESRRWFDDVYLVTDWELDGRRQKAYALDKYESVTRKIVGMSHYFRPGFTYTTYTNIGFRVRTLPENCIFSLAGSGIFPSIRSDFLWILGILNSRFVGFCLELLTDGRKWEPGYIKSLPFRRPSEEVIAEISQQVTCCLGISIEFASARETTRTFKLPALLGHPGYSLRERLDGYIKWTTARASAVSNAEGRIDELVYDLFEVPIDSREMFAVQLFGRESQAEEVEEEEEVENDIVDTPTLVHSLVSYALGCAFGRWDIRLATGERALPELSDPFAALPVCSPGMLQGDDGLPLSEAPAGYPLEIDADGLLVDDPDHDDDVLRRVREVLALLFDAPEAIEREMCEILGERDLRGYFRKTTGFFADHIKRYSKSRRKAPIYWLLQSAKKNYGIWLYYHRLDQDTLSKALELYVRPKLQLEENRLASLRQQRQEAGTSGSKAKKIEKALDEQEALLSELRDFRDKLERAAHLNLKPDLDDGVVLNIAPLYELVPWKEAEKYRKQLLKGEYEWSSISRQLGER